MSEKRRKKHGLGFFDFFEDDFLSSEKSRSAASSGYSISVTYGGDGKPIIRVKTQGNVDKTALKSQLKKKYPDAKIEGLSEEPLIRELSTRTLKHEEKKGQKKPE